MAKGVGLGGVEVTTTGLSKKYILCFLTPALGGRFCDVSFPDCNSSK